MEDKNWKVIWLKNYRGEGDTAELLDFVKKLNYGNRNNVSYLPWATVERIFKIQDGTIEVLPSRISETQTSIVEADRVLIKEEADSNGVVSRTFANSYFVNIRVSWQGQTYVERYPIQDSTGRPLSFWTQNDLNKSIQRGKVKAIAIVSGIGFKLFEDGDLQFEEEKPEGKPIVELKVEPKKPIEQKKQVQVEPKVEVVVKPTPVEVPTQVETKPTPTINRLEIENEIKKVFLSGGADKSSAIRKFLTEVNVKKISDLTDEQLKKLADIIK
jgi:hypothetical protein